jgi:hypothetical protein
MGTSTGHAVSEHGQQLPQRPVIVCLCGSTRFSEAFRNARLAEAKAFRIVLSIGCDTKSDSELLEEGKITSEDLKTFEALHLHQIDLCDEVLILNCGGYIGESTANEAYYAASQGKRIRWLEEQSLEVV